MTMIIFCFIQIFIWIGNDTSNEERKYAHQMTTVSAFDWLSNFITNQI